MAVKAKKSLSGLPRARELRSNKLGDIQDFMQRYTAELDRQYRLLFQAVTTIQVAEDGYIYFGDKDTDGSWRIGRDDADWVLDHKESGSWVNASKQKAT